MEPAPCKPGQDSPAGPPDLVARLRPDGSVTHANQALCRLHGLPCEEVVGRPFVALIDPRDAARVEAELAKLGPAHPAVVTEARPVTHGDSCRVRWTHLALLDSSNEVLEIHSFGRDVTHERSIEEDSARLAAIVAGAEDAIVSKTLDGTITSWNPAAEVMFGYSAAEAIGRPIALIIPPERLHEETEILSRVRRGEPTEHFETERRRKDGRLIPISVNVSPVRDAAGQIIGASKIARDMTIQRRAQENLRVSVRSLEALYRLADRVGQARDQQAVCEAALDAIVAALGTQRTSLLIFDSTGVMRFVAWRGLSDRYRRAMEGHSPWKRDARHPQPILVSDVLADEAMADLRSEITREGIRALAFVPLVYQDRLLGKFMVYFDEVRSLTTEECRLAETIGRHVSFGLAQVEAGAAAAEALDRERAARSEATLARAEAEQASRAKDEFLAMLAHELRNPLGVIVHAVAILRTHKALGSELGLTLSMIDRQSKHLAHLLDDLLDVARITSGRIELERQRLDLSTSVTMAVEAQRVRITAKDQHLTVSLPSGPAEVVGDAVRLQQIIGNLVNNASKYTPPRGSIWVELEVEGSEAVVRVRDTGAGIPTDRLDSIFDLFVQANPTLARTEGGLGVGLTLVKRLVELHQGRVHGRSRGLGEGAEFTVRLPLAQGSNRVVGPLPASPKPSPKRFLVVEDGDDARVALAGLLRLDGHEVHEAATGRAALALAADHRPEVALLDIGLPDMNGYEVGHALRAVFGTQIRLVALTGYAQPTDRARSREAGFDAHLVKPVTSEMLMETLATFLV